MIEDYDDIKSILINQNGKKILIIEVDPNMQQLAITSESEIERFKKYVLDFYPVGKTLDNYPGYYVSEEQTT